MIEHGGTDAGPFIQMPAALSYPMNMALLRLGLQTEPEPHLGGRVLATPRGKVIGGSSSINGMVYVRGHARDFDHWAEQGAQRLVLCRRAALFQADGELARRVEARMARASTARCTSPAARATTRCSTPSSRPGRQAGYPVTDDYNGQQQEGFGPMEATIWKGRRWSAANAYLRPAMKAGNVQLVRGFARRVVIEDGRAVGRRGRARRHDRGDPRARAR